MIEIENLSFSFCVFLVGINNQNVFRSLRGTVMVSDFVQKIFFDYLFFCKFFLYNFIYKFHLYKISKEIQINRRKYLFIYV